MATLAGTTIADTYDSLLHVEDNTAGLVATSTDSRVIQDGVGANSALALATDSVRITSTNKLYFNDIDGEWISGDGTDLTISSGAKINLTSTTDVHVANGTGIVVGHTAQVAMGEVTAETQILGTTETDATLAIGLFSTTDALSPSLKFVKGGHATIGSNTTVADNEELGKIQAYGSDGSDHDTLSSEIAFNIDDDGVGAGTLGGEILLKTSGKDGTLDTAVTIDSSQNVGIGESSPDHLLHLTSAVASNPVLKIENTTNDTSVTTNHGILEFKSTMTSTAFQDDSLIGVIEFRGHDKDDLAEYEYAKIQGVARDPGPGHGSLRFFTSKTGTSGEKMRIDDDGNVGIGETSPSSLLEISRAGVNTDLSTGRVLTLNDTNGSLNNCIGIGMGFTSGTHSPIVIGQRLTSTAGVGKGEIYFSTRDATTDVTSTQRMVITTAGSVGIGNTAPAHTFTVEDNIQQYTASFKNNKNPSSAPPYGVMIRFHETPDNGTSEFLRCDDSVGSSAVARCIISSEGDLFNHDNSYGATSDKRIKQGIKDANSQWDDIKAVKVRNFKKNDDVAQYGDKAWEQIGVIAQELEEAGMDKLVREHPANESEVVVNDDINKGDMVKTVSYSVLYMKAIKALQEAMAKIETLETKVEALENA